MPRALSHSGTCSYCSSVSLRTSRTFHTCHVNKLDPPLRLRHRRWSLLMGCAVVPLWHRRPPPNRASSGPRRSCWAESQAVAAAEQQSTA
eukprot:72832-Chlamydomonas_euryale.AAC.9